MRYRVKLNKSDEGYAIWCPSLPSCWSQGETEAEALENIKDAIQAYLDTVIQSCLDTVEELTENSGCRYVKVE